MNDTGDARKGTIWSRPEIKRAGPVRRAGGFYRSAEGGEPGIGGVPLTTAEDGVVAAVRLAYKVADEQINRGARLGQRLREAGDKAVGPRSDKKAVDATEKLLFDAAMGALSWIEGLAAEDGSPLTRFLTAQYRILGSLLGIEAGRPSAMPGARKESAAAGPDTQSPEHIDPQDRRNPHVSVVLRGKCRRPVRLVRLDHDGKAPLDTQVLFYSVAHIESNEMTGQLTVNKDGHAMLAIEVDRLAASGRWKAAICDRDSVQLGTIEIEL
jgi:hypothetical protein